MSKLFLRILWALSLIIFASIFISPQIFWPAGLISLMIPVVLVFQMLSMCYFLLKGSKLALYPVTILLVGLLFLSRTVAVHGPANDHGTISVLSYNVRVFNVYSHLNENFVSSKATLDWITGRDEDIKCFQEFYYQPGSDIFNSIPVIAKKNPYHHFEPKVTNHIGAQFGMAIFSKYPIINRGNLDNLSHSPNDILFVDLDLGTDTLRVYNVHLQSMSIDENRLTNSNSETISRNLGELFSQLRNGFIRRAEQIQSLCQHIESSPHPVILTGDLNDMPYSYSYQKLKKYLYSSFENGGRGFGFTFNGKLFFLRIDNQFYSDGISISKFQTLRKIKYTDHFPISAVYSLD